MFGRTDYVGDIVAAIKLKNRLAAFWQKSGHPVKFTIEKGRHGDRPFYSIRSDLIGGLPADLYNRHVQKGL